jgi:hypothetical protein
VAKGVATWISWKRGQELIQAKFLQGRALTSLLITLAFLVMLFSGVVLFVAPEGRVVHWTDWRFFGLAKDQWRAVHNTTALLFLVGGFLHLYFNWRPLTSYISCGGRLNRKAELFGAVAIAAMVLVGTVVAMPPFSQMMTLQNRIRAYWHSRSLPAPYAHAEDSTLAEFAERTGTPLEELQAELQKSGVTPTDPSATVGELAREHRTSPSALMGKLGSPGRHLGRARGTGQGMGMSVGRRSISEICEAYALPEEKVMTVLQARGVKASQHEQIRFVAHRMGLSPMDLLRILIDKTKGPTQGPP